MFVLNLVFPTGDDPSTPDSLEYRRQVTMINTNRTRLVIAEDYLRAATTATFSVSVICLVAFSSRWFIRRLR